jgi:hypothetical protein
MLEQEPRFKQYDQLAAWSQQSSVHPAGSQAARGSISFQQRAQTSSKLPYNSKLKAELRRENSISDKCSENDYEFFDDVKLNQPVEHGHFKSEVASCGQVFESIAGSDSLFGDQNSMQHQQDSLGFKHSFMLPSVAS